MALDPDVVEVAGALRVGVGLLRRRLRQLQADDGLTLPETSALAWLDRVGPSTASGLARLEQISPQSMGATLAGLEARGLVERRPDPGDGRQSVLTLTGAGLDELRSRRDALTRQLAKALSTSFSPTELRQLAAATPLLERLAQTI